MWPANADTNSFIYKFQFVICAIDFSLQHQNESGPMLIH